MRRLVLAVTAGAMVAGAMPATAKDRRDDRRSERRDDDRRHHRRDREKGSDAAGGFVLGALAVGLIAVLSSKKTPVAREVTAGDVRAAHASATTDADAAVSACAAAVEGEGQRTFALAQAGQVRAVTPAGEGYAIEGDVLLRGGWREAGERRGFRCTVDAQAVRSVSIDGLRTLPPRP